MYCNSLANVIQTAAGEQDQLEEWYSVCLSNRFVFVSSSTLVNFVTGFHSVAICQFHEDWQNLFHICKGRNIVQYMSEAPLSVNTARLDLELSVASQMRLLFNMLLIHFPCVGKFFSR